jgi:hypothetical protein
MNIINYEKYNIRSISLIDKKFSEINKYIDIMEVEDRTNSELMKLYKIRRTVY